MNIKVDDEGVNFQNTKRFLIQATVCINCHRTHKQEDLEASLYLVVVQCQMQIKCMQVEEVYISVCADCYEKDESDQENYRKRLDRVMSEFGLLIIT